MLSPFSILKGRAGMYLREALDAVLSAEGIPTNDPAYRMIREHWKEKLKTAIQTTHLAGFDLKDRNPTSLTYWLTVPYEDRYQITGDLEAWYKAEKLKEESAGTSPPGSDRVGTVADNPTSTDTKPSRSNIRELKPPVNDSEIDSFLRDVYHKCAEASGSTPTAKQMLLFVHNNRNMFPYVNDTNDKAMRLKTGTLISQETTEDWKKRTVIKTGK